MTKRMPEGMLLLATLLALSAPARPVTFPTGFSETHLPAAVALDRPTAMEIAPDGRIFICEQAGGVRVVQSGVVLDTPFLSLTVDSDGERGLLGVAFDPAFPTTPLVYLYYT